MTRQTPRPVLSRARLAAAVTAAVVAGLLTQPAGPATATVDSGRGRTATDARAQHTVTLITGDVVRVSDVGGGHHAVDVTRARGARGGVRTETIGDHLYVWPDEVLPYVAAGAVDRRLFDVTGLIAQRYDDAHVDRLPLILADRPGVATRSAGPRGADLAPGATRVRRLPSVDGTGLHVPKARARALWDNAVSAAAAPFAAGAAGPDAFDRQILALLLAGLTDDTVANQLGTPVCTVQRRVHQLSVAAGVKTRMQLGWHAARHGWA